MKYFRRTPLSVRMAYRRLALFDAEALLLIQAHSQEAMTKAASLEQALQASLARIASLEKQVTETTRYYMAARSGLDKWERISRKLALDFRRSRKIYS